MVVIFSEVEMEGIIIAELCLFSFVVVSVLFPTTGIRVFRLESMEVE